MTWARLRGCQCALEVWLKRMQLTGDICNRQKGIREMTLSCNEKRWVAEPHLRSYHTEWGACAPRCP